MLDYFARVADGLLKIARERHLALAMNKKNRAEKQKRAQKPEAVQRVDEVLFETTRIGHGGIARRFDEFEQANRDYGLAERVHELTESGWKPYLACEAVAEEYKVSVSQVGRAHRKWRSTFTKEPTS
jgi:hypothetical protein